jgi:hypothetical protein
MTSFPEKLKLLHAGEEFIRARSIEAIEKSDELSLHLAVTEAAANQIYHFVHRDEHRDDDDLIVRLLGIRMFNCINGTLELLLSGYYQASTLRQRDLLETSFLLDLFSTNRQLIAQWRLANDKVLREEFSPVAVRIVLDARDAFTGKKRAEHYKLFSSLAAHPHPRGSQMLKLPNGNHHCGPFFEGTAMPATVSELGKSCVLGASIFAQFFSGKSKADFQVKLAFMDLRRAWFERFFGTAGVDIQELDEMRAMIAALRN